MAIIIRKCKFESFFQDEADDLDIKEEAEGSTSTQKRSSCFEITSNQRWNYLLIVLAVILVILFFIAPDFLIIWEFYLRKQDQSVFGKNN